MIVMIIKRKGDGIVQWESLTSIYVEDLLNPFKKLVKLLDAAHIIYIIYFFKTDKTKLDDYNNNNNTPYLEISLLFLM